jgi:Zn finger protein HypA/HybF involved in hydrogenase expression
VGRRNDALPQIHEKRPRAKRRCLSCSKSILTTAAQRLCPRCTADAAALEVGALAEASSVLTQIYVSEPP